SDEDYYLWPLGLLNDSKMRYLATHIGDNCRFAWKAFCMVWISGRFMQPRAITALISRPSPSYGPEYSKIFGTTIRNPPATDACDAARAGFSGPECMHNRCSFSGYRFCHDMS